MNQYKAGHFVLVYNRIKDRTEIGKIEELDDQSFSYAIYYRPEDTVMGRQPYHSNKELFKTSDVEKEHLGNISSKCEVYKLKRYLKCSSEEKFSDRVYFFRQAYDPMTHKFTPDLESECFCERIINPDDEIVECSGPNCEKLYHYTCITLDNNNCLSCKSQLTFEEGGDPYKRVKLDTENSIALTGSGRNMYEELKNSLKNDGLKMAPLSISRKISQNAPEINRVKSDPKKRRVFPNISEAKEERILKKIDEFSRSNSTKNMTDNEKTRQKTRESLYKYLLYGYEELRANYAMSENLKDALSEERKILALSENKAYEQALNVAREVEATIYAYFKSDIKRYLPKIKILVQFLVHEKNYELRVKVLTKRMSAQDICVAKDQELAPSSVNKMIEKRKEELVKETMLREEKIIAKTHKGETVLEGTDFPEEAAKKDKFDAPATVFATENKIIDEEEEPTEEDEDNYYNGKENYRDYDSGPYNHGYNPNLSGGEKVTIQKSGRDDFLSRPHLTNSKFFDQNLRKLLKENMIEKTYIRLQDRFKNFLKGRTRQSLVDSLDRAIDKISNSA